MFENLLRKKFLKDYDKEQQDILLLSIKDLCKILIGITIIFSILITLVWMLLLWITEYSNWLVDLIIYFGYPSLVSWLLHKYQKVLVNKFNLIAQYIYFYLYTVKGNAILSKDFKQIKQENSELYNELKSQDCKKNLETCYRIVHCLKKGNIKFVMKKSVFEKYSHYIDALYYNDNGWCFDLDSFKQYPLEEFLKIYKAQECATFSYNDIANKSYEEFLAELKED